MHMALISAGHIPFVIFLAKKKKNEGQVLAMSDNKLLNSKMCPNLLEFIYINLYTNSYIYIQYIYIYVFRFLISSVAYYMCTINIIYKEGYMGQYMLILNVQWWKLKRCSKTMQQEYL